MDIRFFASNPLLFFKLEGRRKTEVLGISFCRRDLI